MVKKVKTEEYQGEDRRVDVTKLEFGISTVVQIVLVVAIFVSTAVVYQLQIQSNTKELEDLKTSFEEQSLIHVREMQDLKQVIENIEEKVVTQREFNRFKKWVEDEI